MRAESWVRGVGEEERGGGGGNKTVQREREREREIARERERGEGEKDGEREREYPISLKICLRSSCKFQPSNLWISKNPNQIVKQRCCGAPKQHSTSKPCGGL